MMELPSLPPAPHTLAQAGREQSLTVSASISYLLKSFASLSSKTSWGEIDEVAVGTEPMVRKKIKKRVKSEAEAV